MDRELFLLHRIRLLPQHCHLLKPVFSRQLASVLRAPRNAAHWRKMCWISAKQRRDPTALNDPQRSPCTTCSIEVFVTGTVPVRLSLDAFLLAFLRSR